MQTHDVEWNPTETYDYNITDAVHMCHVNHVNNKYQVLKNLHLGLGLRHRWRKPGPTNPSPPSATIQSCCHHSLQISTSRFGVAPSVAQPLTYRQLLTTKHSNSPNTAPVTAYSSTLCAAPPFLSCTLKLSYKQKAPLILVRQ